MPSTSKGEKTDVNKMSVIRKRDVNIMVEFIRIGEIDTMNEKYQAEVEIEASWLTDEKIINYDPKIHWNPMLYVENLLTETKQTVDYTVDVEENGNVLITESRKIKGIFWERLELQNFPVRFIYSKIKIKFNFRNFKRV